MESWNHDEAGALQWRRSSCQRLHQRDPETAGIGAAGWPAREDITSDRRHAPALQRARGGADGLPRPRRSSCIRRAHSYDQLRPARPSLAHARSGALETAAGSRANEPRPPFIFPRPLASLGPCPWRANQPATALQLRAGLGLRLWEPVRHVSQEGGDGQQDPPECSRFPTSHWTWATYLYR